MSADLREQLIDCVETLASPERQLEYERTLADAGHAPSELVSTYADDLFDLKNPQFLGAFDRDELHEAAHLYGLVVEAGRSQFASVQDMLKDRTWRQVVAVAQHFAARLARAT